MQQSIESSIINQIVIEPQQKPIDFQKELKYVLEKNKFCYSYNFKLMKLRLIESISKIKETQLKINTWKISQSLSKQTWSQINGLEKDMNFIKIELINQVKGKVKEVRKMNEDFNKCIVQLHEMGIFFGQDILEWKELPLKMLHEHYASGLTELLFEANILSPYLQEMKINNQNKIQEQDSNDTLEDDNQQEQKQQSSNQ